MTLGDILRDTHDATAAIIRRTCSLHIGLMTAALSPMIFAVPTFRLMLIGADIGTQLIKR
jgi:hypothetical protein